MQSFFLFHRTTPSGTLAMKKTGRSQTQVGGHGGRMMEQAIRGEIACAALVWQAAPVALLMSLISRRSPARLRAAGGAVRRIAQSI